MQAGERGFFDLESSVVDVGLVRFRRGRVFERVRAEMQLGSKKDWPFVIVSVQATLKYPRDENKSVLFLLDA